MKQKDSLKEWKVKQTIFGCKKISNLCFDKFLNNFLKILQKKSVKISIPCFNHKMKLIVLFWSLVSFHRLDVCTFLPSMSFLWRWNVMRNKVCRRRVMCTVCIEWHLSSKPLLELHLVAPFAYHYLTSLPTYHYR